MQAPASASPFAALVSRRAETSDAEGPPADRARAGGGSGTLGLGSKRSLMASPQSRSVAHGVASSVTTIKTPARAWPFPRDSFLLLPPPSTPSSHPAHSLGIMSTDSRFQNIRVYCACPRSLAPLRCSLTSAHTSRARVHRVLGHRPLRLRYVSLLACSRCMYALTRPVDSGIGGGVVSQKYFKEHFGLLNPDGSTNAAKSDNVSSLVVSVLQAGAFFGALGSAPISGEPSFLRAQGCPRVVWAVGAGENPCCTPWRSSTVQAADVHFPTNVGRSVTQLGQCGHQAGERRGSEWWPQCPALSTQTAVRHHRRRIQSAVQWQCEAFHCHEYRVRILTPCVSAICPPHVTLLFVRDPGRSQC